MITYAAANKCALYARHLPSRRCIERGNDLSRPLPQHGFPGLQPGDRWCLCADRWKEALDAGMAPPVVLASTHAATLEWVSLDEMQQHAVS